MWRGYLPTKIKCRWWLFCFLFACAQASTQWDNWGLNKHQCHVSTRMVSTPRKSVVVDHSVHGTLLFHCIANDGAQHWTSEDWNVIVIGWGRLKLYSIERESSSMYIYPNVNTFLSMQGMSWGKSEFLRADAHYFFSANQFDNSFLGISFREKESLSIGWNCWALPWKW